MLRILGDVPFLEQSHIIPKKVVTLLDLHAKRAPDLTLLHHGDWTNPDHIGTL